MVHGAKYLNFTLRFDYKFKRPADWDDTRDNDIYQGQAGYFMLVKDVTERGLGQKGVGFDGRHFDVLHPPFAENAIEDNEARLRVNKPIGEWNSVEIVAKNGASRHS